MLPLVVVVELVLVGVEGLTDFAGVVVFPVGVVDGFVLTVFPVLEGVTVVVLVVVLVFVPVFVVGVVAGTWAKVPRLIESAMHNAPAILIEFFVFMGFKD